MPGIFFLWTPPILTIESLAVGSLPLPLKRPVSVGHQSGDHSPFEAIPFLVFFPSAVRVRGGLLFCSGPPWLVSGGV